MLAATNLYGVITALHSESGKDVGLVIILIIR